MNFNPGDSWRYSNTGFWIAAKIIAKVEGVDYDQFLSRRFFAELKMQNTGRANIETGSYVNGYVYHNKIYSSPFLDISKFMGEGDGELSSTLGDLLKWNMALAFQQHLYMFLILT